MPNKIGEESFAVNWIKRIFSQEMLEEMFTKCKEKLQNISECSREKSGTILNKYGHGERSAAIPPNKLTSFTERGDTSLFHIH